MEFHGAVYLYSLALLALTFATMSAIVIVLRHTTGETVLPFQLFLTRLYVETGFIVAGFSILPMLLADLGLPHALVWRLCSAIFGTELVLRVLIINRRLKEVTSNALPLRRRIHTGLTILMVVLLALNAAGIPFDPGPGLYELSLTYVLVNRFLEFALNLKSFLTEPK